MLTACRPLGTGRSPTTDCDDMTSPAESITPTTSLYDVAHVFLTRSYRKLPVVDRDGRVIGQVSRRDILVAIESARDNPWR